MTTTNGAGSREKRKSTAPSTDEPDRVVSVVGGTGTGTALAAGGLAIGADTTVGRVLLIVSPATTMFVRSGLLYAQVAWKRWLRDRDEDREAERAREKLRRALDDPNVPPTRKEEFRRLLGDFEREQIDRTLDRARTASQPPGPPSSDT